MAYAVVSTTGGGSKVTARPAGAGPANQTVPVLLFTPDGGATEVVSTVSATFPGSETHRPASEVFDVALAIPPPQDTEKPVIGGKDDVLAAADSADGRRVEYAPPTVTDNADPDGPAACDPPPGSRFGIGTTPVTCSATDTAGLPSPGSA